MDTEKKGKRVFIISHEKFPRCSAGANYIQYFACALQSAGYSVVVIGENNEKETECNNYYKGIEYATYRSYTRNIIKSSFDIRECKKIFTHYKANNNDIFIFYSLEIDGMKYCVRRIKAKMIYGVRVEDMQPIQYKFRVLNPKYIRNRYAIHYMWRHALGDFAISELLHRQDIKHNCDSTILPIMADPFEYGYELDKIKRDKVHFVYPGVKLNGHEDDLVLTIDAIARLDDRVRNRIVIHLTGNTNSDRIKAVIPLDTYYKIKDLLIFHGFMNYEDLILLYKKMDYLLLIRKKNKITEANFPSKVPELLSYGVIPICTDVGDYTKKYLSEECAFIVPPDNLTAITAILQKAVELNQEKYSCMRKKARNLVEQRFFYENYCNQIVNFIER